MEYAKKQQKGETKDTRRPAMKVRSMNALNLVQGDAGHEGIGTRRRSARTTVELPKHCEL